MTSIVRSPAQIDATVRYLLALGTTTVYTPNAGASTPALMTPAAFSAATSTTTYTNGTQFRDLGKSVMTYDPTTRVHKALYKLVQPQLGPTTEGVPPAYPTQKFYVLVWSADASVGVVTVGRTG